MASSQPAANTWERWRGRSPATANRESFRYNRGMAPPSRRRRFQFSLRLVLLVMTLACVIASWIGWVLVKNRYDGYDGLFPPQLRHEHLDDKGNPL